MMRRRESGKEGNPPRRSAMARLKRKKLGTLRMDLLDLMTTMTKTLPKRERKKMRE